MDLFEIIDHTEKHIGKVVNLVIDKVKYSSGHVEIREVIEHSGGSAVIGVLPNNEIIMIKQHRYPINKFIYELPAGKLNKDEDPLDCAKREFEEETGYSANLWQKLSSFYTSPGYSDEIINVYLAKDLKEGLQRLEPGESHLTIEKMNLDIALEKISNGEINDSKTIIGILIYNNLLLK